MKDALLIAFFLAQRWAMYEPVLLQQSDILAKHAAGRKLSPDQIRVVVGPHAWDDEDSAPAPEQSSDEKRGYTMRGSVAVIPINGVISKYAPSVGMISQPRGSYVVELRKALYDAASNPATKSILLMVDSPGGSVAGIDTLADDIRQVKKRGMPVWGFADDLAASAAYWLLSQCDKITASSTAAVGSIGVYGVLADTSKMYEEAGVKVHLVKAGSAKGIGTTGVPISENDLAVVQADIDAYYAAFKGAVKSGRKLTPSGIDKLADGRVHIGKAAVDAGLADDVGKAEDVIGRMERLFGKKPRGGSVAATTQEGDVLGSTTMKDKDLNLADRAGGTEGDQPSGGGGGAPTITKADLEAAASRGAELGAQKAIETLQSSNKAQADKIDKIKAICNAYERYEGVAQLKADALAGTIAVEDLAQKVLGLVAKATPATGISCAVGSTGWERERVALEAVMMVKANPMLMDRMVAGGDVAARIGNYLGSKPEQFIALVREGESNGLRRLRLLDVAERCARGQGTLTGSSRITSDDDIIRAALMPSATLGSSDFSNLVLNLANKTLLQAFAETETTWEQWCSIGSSPDFKDNALITLSEAANLKEVPEGKGSPDESYLNDRSELLKLKTYGRKIKLTRQTMINDDLNALTRLPQMFGQAARRVPEDLAILVLTANPAMSDTVALFNAGHGNLNANAALSAAAMQTAINAFMLQRGFGPDKAELGLLPKFILVPVALQWIAKQLYTSQYDPTPGNTNANVPNPVAGMCKPLVSSRLHRNSTTAWYLAGDPNVHPTVEVRFLNGKREPSIVQVDTGTQLEMALEIIFDCGAKAAAWENLSKNPGA